MKKLFIFLLLATVATTLVAVPPDATDESAPTPTPIPKPRVQRARPVAVDSPTPTPTPKLRAVSAPRFKPTPTPTPVRKERRSWWPFHRRPKPQPTVTPTPMPPVRKSRTAPAPIAKPTASPTASPEKKEAAAAPAPNPRPARLRSAHPTMSDQVPFVSGSAPTPENTSGGAEPKKIGGGVVEDEAKEQAKFKEVKTKALEDKKVQELQAKADDATGEDEHRKAEREYLKALYSRMRKLEPSLKDRIDRVENATMRRIGGGKNEEQ